MFKVEVEVIGGCVTDVRLFNKRGEEIDFELKVFDHDDQQYDEQLNVVEDEEN